jgi:2-oxoglutarate dehydrogenase E2 component (dihydrolipoamide succinyltransferase)
VAGVVTELLVAEGDTVDVGVKLAVISDGATANGSSAPAADPPPPAEAPAEAAVVAPAEAEASPPPPSPPAASTPAVADRPTARPVAPPMGESGEGLVLSPVVRKLLGEHDIDPSTVNGTGLGGRITRSDVEARIASGAPSGTDASGEPAPVPSIAGGSPPAARNVTEGAGSAPPLSRDEVVPFTNIRRRTAEHMVRSKATSAHTLMVKEIDYERVEQVRRAHGERFKADEGFSLSYLPFAARAAVEALAEFPHLNSSVGDDALIIHHDVNLGIAVDLDNEGLIVPVVHNAEELNLLGMARRIRDIADRARNKRLSLDDISGGTFSITNAGPFGTLITGAIINQPQVAILSTDGVSRRPVVVTQPDGGESIAIHSVGLAAMTFDHRAVDGAYVARYLARLAEILHDRDWAGEL